MARQSRPVFAPDLGDGRPPRPPEQGRSGAAIAVAALGLVGFLWMVYGGAEKNPRLIPAPEGPYKEAGPDAALTPETADREVFGVIEGRPVEEEAVTLGPGAEEPMTIDELIAQTAATPTPVPAQGAPQRSGAFLVQLAALRSAEAAQAYWQALGETAPSLVAGATLDVQRADVGAGGVFYRVRAGFFPDRDEAAAFCDRLKAQGKDCMVTAR